MRVVLLVFGAFLTCVATDAAAAPRRIILGPPDTEVAFRAYGLGLLPLDGRFTRFHGLLTYDPVEHSTCRVDLTVEVASLVMTDTSVQETVVGPDFIDAARFPMLAYAGSCQPPGIGGLLELHGMRRPFQLSLTWRPDKVVAEGQLRRADWGMTAMPVVAGRTVRIQVSVPLGEPSGASQ